MIGVQDGNEMNNYQAQQFWNDINGIIGLVTSVMVFGFLFGMTRSITKPLGNPNAKALPSPQEAKGTCYEDAWRFLIKQEEGELVHGTVESLGKRIGHAWVELDTGFIYEPQTARFFEPDVFKRAFSPVEDARYTVEEAAIMVARIGRHGPWSAEERARWLPEHHSSNITTKLFDWATSDYKPIVTGFLTHNTYPDKALQILKNGYIKPFAGSTSFSLDPCFTVTIPSVSFIFPESVIREKYGGRELPMPHYWTHGEEAWRKQWEEEMEVEVKSQLVYIKDCVEILPGRDTCWKYGRGYKYHYVDVRDRDYYPWKEFKREY